MRLHVLFLTFFCTALASNFASAASYNDMETQCKTIARTMMEAPVTFKFIDATPTSRDANKGVAIRYTGTEKNFEAKLSCFYAGDEVTKIYLEATLEDGEKVDEYLAEFLVEQIRKDMRAK